MAQDPRAEVISIREAQDPDAGYDEALPASPEQVLLEALSAARQSAATGAAVTIRDARGVWHSTFSSLSPGEILEAALAFKCEAEGAWSDVQDGLAGEDPSEEDEGAE